MKQAVRVIEWNQLTKEKRSEALKRTSLIQNEKLAENVMRVVKEVKKNGDKAVSSFTKAFDKVDLKSFAVSDKEIKSAYKKLDKDAIRAIKRSIANIEKFHKAQMKKDIRISVSQGLVCGQKMIPIESVGFYVPGGTAPLPSTVMMMGVPARLAGCQERVLCTPPNAMGEIHPAILVAADLCGIKNIFKIGGAQAIAAMAYGTQSVPKVSKIMGPGNQYVTQAKLLVSQDSDGAALDLPAGPSEVLVIADKKANPAFVAADLLSQAEHGNDSQVILVSDSWELLENVQEELFNQCEQLKRISYVESSLSNSLFIKVDSMKEAVSVSNQYAPEHLIIQTANADAVFKNITNAGSVFLGEFAPESFGDYSSGTNHVLPTYGFAKAYSGLNMDAFCKKVTYQKASEAAFLDLANTVETLAALEGLECHKNAVTVRKKFLYGKKKSKSK